MKHAALIESLKKYGTLTDKSIRLLKESGECRTVGKKIHLHYPGEFCKNLYFVNNGFFRYYEHVNDKDRTVGFSGSGEYMTSIESFFNRVSSRQGIVCESKAEIICLNYFAWKAMCEEDPDFNKISLNISIQKLIECNRHLGIYASINTKEKVSYLCSLYPGILNMVSQKSIASHFHVSEQAMSKIIKKLK